MAARRATLRSTVEPNTKWIPKVKLEIVAPDARAPQIVEAIVANARSGKIGDGKIFVSSIEEAVRIRNGDRGENAL